MKTYWIETIADPAGYKFSKGFYNTQDNTHGEESVLDNEGHRVTIEHLQKFSERYDVLEADQDKLAMMGAHIMNEDKYYKISSIHPKAGFDFGANMYYASVKSDDGVDDMVKDDNGNSISIRYLKKFDDLYNISPYPLHIHGAGPYYIEGSWPTPPGKYDDLTEPATPTPMAPTGGPSGYYDFEPGWVTVNDAVDWLAINRWQEHSWHLANILKATWRWGGKQGTSKLYDVKKVIYSACRLFLMLEGKQKLRAYLQEILDDPQFKDDKDG